MFHQIYKVFLHFMNYLLEMCKTGPEFYQSTTQWSHLSSCPGWLHYSTKCSKAIPVCCKHQVHIVIKPEFSYTAAESVIAN